ncbi:hypothetical protein ACHAQA_009107 [Verticillium albo-atrum]
MFNLQLSYSWLYWTRPSGEVPDAPAGLERHWVETPSGRLEVLSNQPSNPSKDVTPIVFVHGGMGSAWVWAEYMQYLAGHNIPCYAVSLRGHGNSWHPSYLRMVYCTTRSQLASDAVAVINWVHARQGKEALLVGHSSGGGLLQGILGAKQARAQGLALLGAVPGFGSFGVYTNWAIFDPLFVVRMWLQGGHSNSPLSHPALTKRAFFSDEYPETKLLEFQAHCNRYESFWWPMTMLRPFVDSGRLVESIGGWGRGERIMVMTGTLDKLMTHDIMVQLADTYRKAVARLVGEKKLDAKLDEVRPLSGEGGQDNEGLGVRLAWVEGAGHHLQNDLSWEVGAKKLLEFHEQL